MAQILVIDSKLIAYTWSFYARREITNALNTIFNIIKSHNLQPDSIIWASDKGRSFRGTITDKYKGNRQQRFEVDESTRLRKEAFDWDYNNLIPALKFFGNSLYYPSIEADDIANIVASSSFESDDEIILVSSDRDWGSMLYTDRVKMLHLKRNIIYTRGDIEEAHGQYPIDILLEQVFCGSNKENIKGLHLVGKKHFKGFIDTHLGKPAEVNSIEAFKKLFNSRLSDIRGILLKEYHLEPKKSQKLLLSERIPEEFKEGSVDVIEQFDAMIAFNVKLFTPIFMSYLNETVADTFVEQLSTREVLKDTSIDLLAYGISYSANKNTYEIVGNLK